MYERLTFYNKSKSFLFKILGYNPIHKEIYLKALQHKSYSINENNERLEFLGDAILDFIVAKQLYLENPNQEEGFLSQQRAIIVGGIISSLTAIIQAIDSITPAAPSKCPVIDFVELMFRL